MMAEVHGATDWERSGAETRTMKKCQNCGTENPPDAVFCANCGMSLPVRAPVRKEAVRRAGSKEAGNWYLWLWLSPLVTVPSLAILAVVAYFGAARELICGGSWLQCNDAVLERAAVLMGVFGSALWHLILLLPALAAKSEFVRWHGRQALLLAGVRTIVPLLCGIAFGANGVCLFALILLPTYVIGNLWGQRQAARGDCSLMRQFGREPRLLPLEPGALAQAARGRNADALVEIVRYSRDPEERRHAVAELEKLGMVESLDPAADAPPIPARPVPSTPRIRPRPAEVASSKPLWKRPRFLLGVGLAFAVLAVCARLQPSSQPAYAPPPPPTTPRPRATATPTTRPEGRSSAVDYRTQGLAHHREGEYEEAIADFTEAIRADPTYWLAYLSRGNSLCMLGEYQEATSDFREAIRLNPDSALGHNSLAWTLAYHLDTDYEEALEHALRAVELDPDAYGRDTLALVYYKLERYQDASRQYSAALSLDPEQARSYRGRGDVYVALGDYQAATDDYRRYLELEPEASDRQAVEEAIERLQGQAE